MYGMRGSCPPQAPMFDELVEPPYFLVMQELDLEEQELVMKRRHPEWSSRMCRNPRYWQGKLMHNLIAEAKTLAWKVPDPVILKRPEANGVNLFSTCRLHGIRLERNPHRIVKKMVIVGARAI